MRLALLPLVAATILWVQPLGAQSAPRAANFDEAKAGTPTLPELDARSAEQWTEERRPLLLQQFAEHVYGKAPTNFGRLRHRLDGTRPDALNGTATRRLIHLDLPDHPEWQGVDVLLYVPNRTRATTGTAPEPVPCFIALNFEGNQAATAEADVPITKSWIDSGPFVVDHRATAESRGTDPHCWPLRELIEHGFAAATAYYGDIEPDHESGWRQGVRGAIAIRQPQSNEGPHAWGAIGAWAFGLSRIVDHLLQEPAIDARRIAVLGHSRLGKAALWAGAQDERITLVIANESGEGGAALMRRDFGETTALITHSFPHWFCGQYADYAADASKCPVDSHQLLALIAPRLLYVGSASKDHWADPKGEFLATRMASTVWPLFGKRALPDDNPPSLDHSIGDDVGYHVRTGKHGLTEFDWREYMKFAQRHW